MTVPLSVEIGPPRNAEDDAAIKALFAEYAASLDFSLGYQNFDAELADFPGKYGLPRGALLLARVGADAAGTVALRPLSDTICEMKRLYVRPAFRGQRTGDGRSLGRALTQGIVLAAQARGYERLRLDTIGGTMKAAVALYRSMGFVEIPPYADSPIPGTLYMELVL